MVWVFLFRKIPDHPRRPIPFLFPFLLTRASYFPDRVAVSRLGFRFVPFGYALGWMLRGQWLVWRSCVQLSCMPAAPCLRGRRLVFFLYGPFTLRAVADRPFPLLAWRRLFSPPFAVVCRASGTGKNDAHRVSYTLQTTTCLPLMDNWFSGRCAYLRIRVRGVRAPRFHGCFSSVAPVFPAAMRAALCFRWLLPYAVVTRSVVRPVLCVHVRPIPFTRRARVVRALGRER